MEVIVTQYGERSKEQNEIFTALGKLQGLVEAIPRNNRGEFEQYSDLDAVMAGIRGPMFECGLSLYQFPHDLGEGYIRLETTIGHTSGQFRTGYKHLYLNGADDADQGGSVGYWSRICLMKSLGLRSKSLGKAAPDDDDGRKGRGALDVSLSSGKAQKWYEAAEKALSLPNADRGELLTKVYDSVQKGDMTQEMLDDLRTRYPVGDSDAK